MAYLLLAAAIVAEVIATTCMKLSDGLTNPLPSVVTLLGYGFAFTLLSRIVQVMPTGIAYAIWSGVGIVLITGVAWALLGQKLDGAALVGIGLILTGVIVLNVFSKSVIH